MVPGPIRGALGHSFGGKVALAWADANAARLHATRLFLVDSNPGMRLDARGSEGTMQTLRMLETLPSTFESRPAFVNEVRARGFELHTAQWLAMNVEANGDGTYRFGLELPAIRAMLDDYFQRDFWRVIESPPGDLRVVIVNGGRSDNYSAEDTSRAAAIASARDDVELHVIPKAAHWVHADAPEELLAIVNASL
jgi:pimeloyl-ACP methyl ester carboxylesterase